jgi:hypothetical protein
MAGTVVGGGESAVTTCGGGTWFAVSGAGVASRAGGTARPPGITDNCETALALCACASPRLVSGAGVACGSAGMPGRSGAAGGRMTVLAVAAGGVRAKRFCGGVVSPGAVATNWPGVTAGCRTASAARRSGAGVSVARPGHGTVAWLAAASFSPAIGVVIGGGVAGYDAAGKLDETVPTAVLSGVGISSNTRRRAEDEGVSWAWRLAELEG